MKGENTSNLIANVREHHADLHTEPMALKSSATSEWELQQKKDH